MKTKIKHRIGIGAAILAVLTLGTVTIASGAASPLTVTLTPDSAGKYACSVMVNNVNQDCVINVGAKPTPTQTSTPTQTPTPTNTVTPTTPPATGTETIINNAYTTGYTYWDNTPPGSADISHPIIHNKAGGKGTYADPVTIAVGHSIINGKDILDYPAGTKMYIPNLQKYFIVEDTCGDGNKPQNGPCHTDYPSSTSTWVDVWVGGQTSTNSQADACASKLTDENGEAHRLIINPKNNYKVVSGDILLNGVCRANYGNTAIIG